MARQKVQDYKLLVKFRLSMTVVFSSVMAYLIAVPGAVNWVALLILASGGFLVTGAANTLNQVLEKDYDRLMKRTENRPLAAGRMKVSEAVMAAGMMSLFGITFLALFNPWTAFFGTFALVTYAFLYTPMKRLSEAAVTVGAIPGALPTLIGCVAAQGELTWLGLSLFALQFCWQFPHFWSIGWLGYEDYAKAGYKLMGESRNNKGWQALAYTMLLLPVGAAPYWLGAAGLASLVVVVALTLGYAYFSWKFARASDRKAALQLMFYSFVYIPAALIALAIDKI
jgi:protoheme IX farnesyltransferase